MPELGEVNFGNGAIDANDRLTISAEVIKDLLRGDPLRPQPVTVYLRVTDAFDRVVASKDIFIPNTGGQIAQELALVDLMGPYARAELFAAPVVDEPLSWWVRERATYRTKHLSVRQPLPSGLTLIVDEPGEGSFAGSELRKEWAAAGVEYVFPTGEPDLGNIAADGLRPVARLGDESGFPGDRFDAASRPGIALRQEAARYAVGRPGLYVVAAGADGTANAEKNRAAIERVVRETDPKAVVALLDGSVSATGTSGFLVLPADVAILDASERPAAFMAIHALLLSGDRASALSHWLPWLAAMYQANALWISPDNSDDADGALAELFAEAGKVRDGYDVLLRRATPAPAAEYPELKLSKDFAGVVRRYTLGGATLFAFLSDPAAESKASIDMRADENTRVYVPTAPATTVSRKATVRLEPGNAAVAAFLPYEVSRIVVEAPPSVVAGRRLVINATVKTRGGLPGDHVLRVSCVGPQLKPLPHYSRTVYAPGGAGSTWLPIAFSDTPGVYRIVVRDVLSGVIAEAEFTVIAP